MEEEEGEEGVFRRTQRFTESCLIFNASSELFQNQALNNPKPNSFFQNLNFVPF